MSEAWVEGMRTSRPSVIAALLLGAILLRSTPAQANEPTDCARFSALNFCVEWGTGTRGHDGSSGGNNPSAEGVVCYWVTINYITDPTIYVDYGLDIEPPGSKIIWQEKRCSDGSGFFPIRWVFALTPGQTATDVRARLEGSLPQPTIAASPAIGTASIISVPVFVAVTNWTGIVTDAGCAGAVCVTVTATPTLYFSPGEPAASSIACAGSGSRFDAAKDLKLQAATSGACAYSYRQRTGVSGRPAAWPGVVSVSWVISWRANTGETGTLPSVTRSTALPRSVQEIQTIIVGGSIP